MIEFQLIRQIQHELSLHAVAGEASGVKLGIGDDGAVLELAAGKHLVAVTDTLNAGIHFPINTSPYDIGYKCLAVNLSDLAAMGAHPCWALLSLSLPDAQPEWVHSFIAGFKSLASIHGLTLVGGDTTRGPLSVSLTALGVVKPGKQLTRSGAKPGDLLIVSGSIGGAARVLKLLQSGDSVRQRELLDRPEPRVGLGKALSGYASACIDVSDGLLADLGHLLKASGCGARLEIAKLPKAPLLDELDDGESWTYQLSGGDDYELLFTLPGSRRHMLQSWRDQLAIDLSIIGEIEDGEGVCCIAPDGTVYEPQNVGFEHFSQIR